MSKDLLEKELAHWEHWLEHEKTALEGCEDEATIPILQNRIKSYEKLVSVVKEKLNNLNKSS